MISGGSWSVYWYNGLIVSSEIARGLDIFELLPSGLISQNEIDAAKTVQLRLPERAGAAEDRVAAELRQGARVSRSARALQRPRGGAHHARCAATSRAPRSRPAQPRQQALKKLATQLNAEAAKSSDQPKARMLTEAVRELAASK